MHLMKEILNILQNIHFIEAKKRWNKKEDFEDFYKFCRSYNKSVDKEDAKKVFYQFTGILIKKEK